MLLQPSCAMVWQVGVASNMAAIHVAAVVVDSRGARTTYPHHQPTSHLGRLLCKTVDAQEQVASLTIEVQMAVRYIRTRLPFCYRAAHSSAARKSSMLDIIISSLPYWTGREQAAILRFEHTFG